MSLPEEEEPSNSPNADEKQENGENGKEPKNPAEAPAEEQASEPAADPPSTIVDQEPQQSLETPEIPLDTLDDESVSHDPAPPEIDISTLMLTSKEEARDIAEIILDVLELDLYGAWKEGRFGQKSRHLSDPGEEKKRRKDWLRDNISNLSLVSNLSEQAFELEAPSELNLSYEKVDSPQFRRARPRALRPDSKVDQEIQVKLSRKAPYVNGGGTGEYFTQTREFSKLSRDVASKEYMRLYPLPEDWVEPPVPSRTGSLLDLMNKVTQQSSNNNGADPDLQPVGPKPQYKKTAKQRILPPINGDYQRTEAYWTGSSFTGEFKDRTFEKGTYKYPTHVVYKSEFKNGQNHSKKHFGIISYPRGDTFEGTWRKGRFEDGQITFADGLKFEPMGWRYCTPPDRRFYIEHTHGVRGIGETYYSNRNPPPKIPYGWYDVGDGIYNPETGQVVNYQGIPIRKATKYEHRWIILNCRKAKLISERYEPCFVNERTPDAYAQYVPKTS